MDIPRQSYPLADYIHTDSGNKVSRKATISGSQNIVLGGKTIIQSSAVLRGDLRRAGGGSAVVFSIGRYSTISSNVVLRPPAKTYKGVFSYYPVKIGDHVYIGQGSVIEAAAIGNNVIIGRNCVISPFTIIKDNVQILDNSYIPPKSVIPSFAVMGPAKIMTSASTTPQNPPTLQPAIHIDDLPECAPEMIQEQTREFYDRFVGV